MSRILLSWLLTVAAVITALAALPNAGRYTGDWNSEGSGSSGRITLSLAPSNAGSWTATAEFTLNDSIIKCEVKQVEVTDGKIIIAYDFTLGEYKLRSTLNGQVKGSKIEGTYTTREVSNGSGVDQGRFSASAQ
jgi:hypothetical protein